MPPERAPHPLSFCLGREGPIPSLPRANSSGIRRGISPREGTGASCPSRARIIAATASRSPRARPSEVLGRSIFVRLGASCVVGGREANDESAARHSAVSPEQRSSHLLLYRPTECTAMFAWLRKEMYGDVRWGRSSSWASCARSGVSGGGSGAGPISGTACVCARRRDCGLSALRSAGQRERDTLRPPGRVYSEVRRVRCGVRRVHRGPCRGPEARGPFVRFRGRLRNTELKELRFAARAYRHGDERNTARLLIAPGASIPDTRTDLRRAARTAVRFPFRRSPNLT